MIASGACCLSRCQTCAIHCSNRKKQVLPIPLVRAESQRENPGPGAGIGLPLEGAIKCPGCTKEVRRQIRSQNNKDVASLHTLLYYGCAEGASFLLFPGF